jgi:flavin-dependent dehydrogenase
LKGAAVDSRCDVVVAGGGLAGLCAAIQLVRADASLRVLVAERSAHPLPEAAHKVGESSVEMASHYIGDVLGLRDLLDEHVPKFGLRFFMSRDGNRDLATRLECGPSHFLSVPSYQIDRGRFETRLAERAREAGVRFLDHCKVRALELGEAGADHVIQLERDSQGAGRPESFAVSCRWLVDASGRAGLLKKKLGLARANRHDVNAAWFRIDRPLDLDDWSEDPAWRSRCRESRRLSTNHLMGEGYWVWLIPLAKGRTSVGIVADARLHPFDEIHTFDKALAWLEVHEPKCAGVVRDALAARMDFRALKDYSHDVKQVFSADRWAITGEAGAFVDPFYSSGSDFIGLANGLLCDLIARDRRGEDLRDVAQTHDRAYRSLARTFLVTYHRQYPLMGSGRVMTVKILWDFVMYWGGAALLFFRDKFTDPAFMDRARPLLQHFATLNLSTQALFRTWAKVEGGEPREAGSFIEREPGGFIDYAEIGFLAELNRSLQEGGGNDDDVLHELARNLRLAEDLKREIEQEVARAESMPAPSGEEQKSTSTSHLKMVFESLRAGESEKA